MGLFGSKKEKGTKKISQTPKDDSVSLKKKKTGKELVLKVEDKRELNTKSSNTLFNYHDVVLRPIITEKSNLMSAESVFVFEVGKGFNKNKVAEAMKNIYGHKPVRVSILKNKSKKVFSRGKVGYTKSMRKAYVAFPKGVKIDLV